MRMNDHRQPVGADIDTTRFPRPRPAGTTLHGRFCSVVPYETGHNTALFAAFVADTAGTNWTYLPYGPFATLAEFTDWTAAACAGPDPMFHTVVSPDGTPVGLATFMRIDPAMGVMEVGNIHFSPHLQRTPAATEAMFLMMQHALGTLGYRRYEWKCDALNAPSRAAAARLGFTYEGIFRQAIHYKGRNRDTAWYAIIDTDWPRIRDAFEAWLAPENFDAGGQQKSALAARAPD